MMPDAGGSWLMLLLGDCDDERPDHKERGLLYDRESTNKILTMICRHIKRIKYLKLTK